MQIIKKKEKKGMFDTLPKEMTRYMMCIIKKKGSSKFLFIYQNTRLTDHVASLDTSKYLKYFLLFYKI